MTGKELLTEATLLALATKNIRRQFLTDKSKLEAAIEHAAEQAEIFLEEVNHAQ